MIYFLLIRFKVRPVYRRISVILMLLLLIPSLANAEIPCECKQEPCSCFIQYGDTGLSVLHIEEALASQGYLAGEIVDGYFDQKTVAAVKQFQIAHGLSPSGVMDDDTLTLLLWGMLPPELDAARPDTSSLVVWGPTDGGKRHHDNPHCCKMTNPRLVSQRNAMAMEMTHCGICKPAGYFAK